MGRAEDLFQRLERDGVSFLDELIATRKSEELFLEFKRSANGGKSVHLDNTDRDHLAKALSGFANSDGGVVVWGVGSGSATGADVASSKHPLADAARFASQLDGAISGCTVPPVSGVRSIPILASEGVDGFAATLIPQSFHAPHQATSKLYYMSAGASFQPVPHGVLAGLFGRPPRPKVILEVAFAPLRFEGSNLDQVALISVTPILANDSAVIAADLYLTVLLAKKGSEKTTMMLTLPDESRWQLSGIARRHWSMVSVPGVRLAPRRRVILSAIHFKLVPPFDEAFDLRFTVGSSGAPPTEESFRLESNELTRRFDEALSRWSDPQTQGETQWTAVGPWLLGHGGLHIAPSE